MTDQKSLKKLLPVVELKLTILIKSLALILAFIYGTSGIKAQSCMMMPPQNQPQMKKWILPPNILDFSSNGILTSTVLPTSPYFMGPTEPDFTAVHSSNAVFDEFGNLLFYVMDEMIYNSIGQTIYWQWLNPSYRPLNTVETIILPRPGHPMQYYVIKPEGQGDYDSPWTELWMQWNIVDMNLPTTATCCGNGDVLYQTNQRIEIVNGGNNALRLTSIHQAVTPLRDDGTYLLFLNYKNAIKRVEVSSTGISVLSGIDYLPANAINIGGHASEMEIIELPSTTPPLQIGTTPNYRLALTYRSNLGHYYYVADLDNNGNVIAYKTVRNMTNTNADPASYKPPKGLEFSPNGKYLYVSQYDSQNPLNYIDLTSLPIALQNFAVNNAEDYKQGHIEMAIDGNMYFASASKLGVLADPNNPSTANWSENNSFTVDLIHDISGTGWNCSASSMTSQCAEFMVYALPDQIDGEIYNNEYNNPDLCEGGFPYDEGVYTVSEKTTLNTETWTANNNPFGTNGESCVYIKDELRIKNGNSITISDMDFYFGPDADVIIEVGAHLELNSTTFTSNDYCDPNTMWNGIQVWGNPQPPNNQWWGYTPDDGSIEVVNGSVIENAKIGISTGDPSDLLNTTEGLIYTNNAIIKNCNISINLMYSGYHRFFSTTFIVDQDHHSINDFEAHLKLTKSLIIQMSDCEFSDYRGMANFSTTSGIGIYSFDSFFDTDFYNNNPPTTFNNLNYGIKAINSTNMHFYVRNSVFNNNVYGTYYSIADAGSIYGNTFNIGGLSQNLTVAYQYGILSDHSQVNEIEMNTFEKVPFAVAQVKGLSILNSGGVPNEVKINVFKNNDIGQEFIGLNRNINNDWIGLQSLCNENFSNDEDINIFKDNDLNRPDGIRVYQGGSNTGAGNIFSANASMHIENQSGKSIDYHYNNSTYQPLYYTPFLVVPKQKANMNACAADGDGQPGMPPMEPGEVGMLTGDFYSKTSNYNSLLYNYYQLLDDGNTDSLMEAINLTWPADAQAMRNELMDHAPYLSQDALWEAAGTGILTDALLLEVCLANIDATRDEGFLDYVEYEIPNPLPANMVQLIYQNWDTETPRTLMESQLADLNAEIGEVSNLLLSHWKIDMASNRDSIENIYKLRNTIPDQYSIAEMAVALNDFEGAYDQMEDIISNNGLADFQMEEHANLLQYFQYREDLFLEGKNILMLEEGDLNELRGIAEENTGRSSVMAQNILCFGYKECPMDEEPLFRKKSSRIYVKENSSNIAELQTVRISPNPAQNVVKVEFSGDGITEIDALFKLSNTKGQFVLEEKLSNNPSMLDLSGISTGIYIYSISSGGKEIQTGKLIINK